MSNAERWDHSGYKELQNEEKSNSTGIKRTGSKKNFYKYNENMNIGEKNSGQDYMDQSSHRKNPYKKISNFSSSKIQNEEWPSDKEKSRQEVDLLNSMKNKQRKKRKEDNFSINESNSDKYFYRQNFKQEEAFRESQMNKTDFSNYGPMNLNMPNRGFNNCKNPNYMSNQMMPQQVGPFYNSQKQFSATPGYNNIFQPGYNYAHMYPNNLNNSSSNIQQAQMNQRPKRDLNISSPTREDEQTYDVKEYIDSEFDQNSKTQKIRNQQNNETNDTNVSENSINSRIHTPQRTSLNSINTAGSNFNQGNTQNTPGNSVGYSPKNDQIFMCNLLKMPNSMPFNSPMRQMNENLMFQNYQNVSRGMNYMNLNQQPFGVSPMRSMEQGMPPNMGPMMNMQGNIPNTILQNTNPINSFSPVYTNFNQSPYNNSLNYSNKINSPLMEDMSNVNHELRNGRKFPYREGNNFSNNMINPNQMNLPIPMVNNMSNKVVYEKQNFPSNNNGFNKKITNGNFQQIQNNKPYVNRKNMGVNYNNPNNIPPQMYRMKMVKSEKFVNPNYVNDGKVGPPGMNTSMIPNDFRQINKEKNWKNSEGNKIDATNIINKNISNQSEKPKDSTKTFESVREENDSNRRIVEENGDSSHNQSDYEVTEEEAKLGQCNENILFVTVKLKDGEETVTIIKGADIYQTAQIFVVRHQLSLSLIRPICESIKQALNSLDIIMDLPLTDRDHKSLTTIENFYQEQKEEELIDFDLSCITDFGTSNNCLGDSFSLSNDEFRKIERLNLSR